MNPWIDWENWRTVHRWWLARGCPPVLRDERPWVRAFRIALLCGVQGALAALLAGALWGVHESLPFPEPLAIQLPPLVFALLVLFPLSRWLDRGWIMTALTLLVSIAAYWASVFVFLWTADQFDHAPGSFDGFNGQAGGLIGGLSSGLLLGLWMTHPGRRAAILDTLRAGGAGMLGGLGFGLLGSGPADLWWTDWFPQLAVLAYGQPHVPFQTLVAIALGMRLLPMAVPIHNGELADSVCQ